MFFKLKFRMNTKQNQFQAKDHMQQYQNLQIYIPKSNMQQNVSINNVLMKKRTVIDNYNKKLKL